MVHLAAERTLSMQYELNIKHTLNTQ